MSSQSVTVRQATDVKPGDLAALEVKGVRIAIANVNGQLFAIDELCTHEQCSLAEEGILEGTVVTCGCHGAQFDVTTGQVLAPPAVEPLKVHGITTIFDDAVARFEGQGRVERVVTKRGRRIDCDFAVVGVGVEPVVDLVTGSGIETDNGILVDEHCRTTADTVFAAGDVANHYHPVFKRRLRVEHWQNAMQQGAAAARSMLETGRPYDDVHWFWSDQYDANLQYAGFHHDRKELVVRGSLEGRDFVAFYLNDGRVDAVVALNRGKDVRRAMPLIKARAIVDRRLLEDEDVDLRSLAHAEVSGGPI
jgi:NADPH-dependent 2,4-dienoyl-CoA reductase/sulfur reductase-like enzyme